MGATRYRSISFGASWYRVEVALRRVVMRRLGTGRSCYVADLVRGDWAWYDFIFHIFIFCILY